MKHEPDSLLLKNILLDIEGFSIVLSIILLVIYWKRSEKNKFLVCYTFYQVIIVIYVSSHMMIHLNQGFNLQEVYFAYIKNISFVAVEVTCIILFWIFTNPQKKFDKKIILLFTGQIIYVLLIITNNWHGIIGTVTVTTEADAVLEKTDFCIALEYFICILPVSLILICVKKLVKMRGYKLIQGTLILSALLIPLLLYGYRKILNQDLLPSLVFDPVPVAISISTIFLAIAALRYKLISLIPVAFKEFAESISTPFMVLDNLNMIQYYNNAFSKVFSCVHIEKQQHIQQFLQQLENNIKNSAEVTAINTVISSSNFTNIVLEVCLYIPDATYYNVSIQPIIAYGDEQVGKLISFTDITGYKNLIATEAELAATKARFEISRDAHDVIGYAMTHIIMYLHDELANLPEEEINKRNNTVNALKIAREKTQEIRKLLYKNIKNTPTPSEIQGSINNSVYRILCNPS